MAPPAQPVVFFREGAPTPYLQPDWVARSASSGFQISCYFANMYRAAPWPKSGGFCAFLNVKADRATGAIMLPDDLAVMRPSPQWDEVVGGGIR